MAERVDKIPPVRTGSRAGKYPWHEWFDGSLWELVEGKDFETSAKMFRNNAVALASRRRINITTAVRSDRVYIQAQLNGEATP